MKKLTKWAKFCMIASIFTIFGGWIGMVINSKLMFGGYMFLLGWEITVVLYELRISGHLPLKLLEKKE